MKTFTQEITFARLVPQQKEGEESIEWVEVEVTKEATFKELSRIDTSQHKLHFLIMAMGDSFTTGNDGKPKIDYLALMDLGDCAIECLLIPDKEIFTEQDKIDFRKDSIAMMSFTLPLLKDKLAPFFLTLSKTLKV